MESVPVDPIAWVLSRIRWDVFGTLTFRGRVPRPGRAFGAFWRWYQNGLVQLGQSQSRCLLALREESGERRGRGHFHFLLGGLEVSNLMTTCHFLRWTWRFNGFGDVRIYERSRAGVSYVTKCLGAAGNAYELNKFGEANTVTLSNSVLRVIRSLERMGTEAAVRKGEKTPGCRALAVAEIPVGGRVVNI